MSLGDSELTSSTPPAKAQVLEPTRPNGRPSMAVDLFAGTGNATSAFRTHGWQVIALDLLRPGCGKIDVCADVRRLPLRLGPDVGRPVDFLWASPPCTEFSEAHPRRRQLSWRPSLDLIVAALEAVRQLRPRFWILENVRGAIPFLGTPAQKIGPWCLWGYFPLIEVSLSMHDHRKGDHHSAQTRAAVPPAMAEAVYQAVTRAAHLPSLLELRPFRRHRHIAARSTAAELPLLPLLSHDR